MNGFNQEWVGCGHSGGPPCPHPNPQYAYVPHKGTKPYFDMGKQYVVADQMYASNFDASSFISHQYIIAAQAESSVNYPWSHVHRSGRGVAADRQGKELLAKAGGKRDDQRGGRRDWCREGRMVPKKDCLSPLASIALIQEHVDERRALSRGRLQRLAQRVYNGHARAA